MSTSERGDSGRMVRTLIWLFLALGGIGLWIFFLNGTEGGRAWRSLLINFLFFSSLAGGLVVWPALVDTCLARWHARLERVAAAGIAFSIPSLAALVVLWIGSPGWAPWYRARFHQGIWLDNDFLFGRDLAALLVFWGLAAYHLRERSRGKGRRCGTILVLVYCLVFSLLGFDLVMALDPHWYSNLAGGYFFISGLYIAITCWALLSSARAEARVEQLHDMGRLIVGFSLLTTYLMYAHLLALWYENLPHEVRFPLARMHSEPWRMVSYLLLCLVYFGPLVLLITEWSKRNRWSLGVICLAVLVGMWIERWWLVAPTFEPVARLGLSELSLAAGCIGILGLGMELFHRYLPEPYRQEWNEP
jgi:protein-S-isoprenylcysteine O-methyltransferase Ste14